MGANLAKVPEEILRTYIPEYNVNMAQTKIKDHIAKLYDGWERQNKPKGLALPQLRICGRVILCRFKDQPVIMVNPVIKKKSKICINSNEGCESVPKGRYIVKRSLWVVVEYYDEDLKKQNKFLFWSKARVAQHEIDHLNGFTIDRVGTKWKAEPVYKKYYGGK